MVSQLTDDLRARCGERAVWFDIRRSAVSRDPKRLRSPLRPRLVAREREAAEPVDRRPVFDDSEIDVESRSAVLELDDSGIEGEARPEHDALAPACRAPREDDRERVHHRLLGIRGDSLAVAVALDARHRIRVLDQPERGEPGVRLDRRRREPRLELGRERIIVNVRPGAPRVLDGREVIAECTYCARPRRAPRRVDQRRDQRVRLELLGWQQRPVGARRREGPERRRA